MNLPPAVIDTNVVVAGLLTSDPDSPTAVILDGMLEGRFRYVLSIPLLAEYRQVLLRPKIRELHRLSAGAIDRILVEIATNGRVLEAGEGREEGAGWGDSSRGDEHLWQILERVPEAVLVTGDKELQRDERRGGSVMAPARWVELAGRR
jgi:predicted nucleic acid-binding protein